MATGLGREHDLNDIESIRNIWPVQQPKPLFGCADDALLLDEVDRLARRAEQVRRSAFHFNEDENIGATVAADHIDLTSTPRLKVSIQNLVPVSAEEMSGQVFTARAENEVMRDSAAAIALLKKAGNKSAPPVRKISDGSHKAREFEAARDVPESRNPCCFRSRSAGTPHAKGASYGLWLLWQ